MAASRPTFKSLQLFSRRFRCSRLICRRNLLSDSNLGMEHYLRQRIFKNDELGPYGKDLLLNKLRKIDTVAESSLVAFDINDLIHVAESKSELKELERLVCLVSGSPATSVSSIRFGASLMRLYHHLNAPDEAYTVYKNEVCKYLLEDNTCHKILMDLLYNNQRYHQVLDVYETLKHFNIDCITLVFGAYFHINTARSAQLTVTLLQQLHSHSVSQRALHFATMLYLNQHLPGEALKCLQLCKQNTLTYNLQIMCTAQQGRVKDLLSILERAKMNSEDMMNPLNTRLYADTMKEVKLCIVQAGSSAQSKQFSYLDEQLAFNGAISSQTVSTLLDRTLLDEGDLRKVRGKRSHIK